MNKEKENIIEIISTLVTVNRVFEYIEDVTCCVDLIPSVNSWFSVVYFMGFNLDVEHSHEEELQKKYTSILVDACKTDLSGYDTACLIYMKAEEEIIKDLRLFPCLKVV
ncbi:MAG: hypothetical protein COC06_10335 [Bacteroidales bacterium]|nr:MAG: hypothetical protein COC06_10335 [Bacteroidales bacterium]